MKVYVKILLGVLIVSILFSTPAYAVFFTGDDLNKSYLEWRKSKEGADFIYVQKGFYAGYVMGVVDLLIGFGFDMPSDVSAERICDIVGRYMETHSDIKGKAAPLVVGMAIEQEFPQKDRAAR